MRDTLIKRLLTLFSVVILVGCTTVQDFTACTLVAGFANQRSYTFDGRVNGEHVKDTVDWTADYRDPSYIDPISCTQMLARRRELMAHPPQTTENAAAAPQDQPQK